MPSESGSRYPSLPHWLASRRQHRELLGEELRLLYVAMTRARDTLLLSATITESKFEKAWKRNDSLGEPELSSATTYADWLAIWFSQNCAANSDALEGQNTLLRWMIHDDTKLAAPPIESPAEAAGVPASLDPEAWQEIQGRLEWKYPFTPATGQPAKIRVSEFSSRAAERPDEEAAALAIRGQRSEVRGQRSEVGDQKSEVKSQRSEIKRRLPLTHSPTNSVTRLPLTAAEIGSIHHTFLEFVSLAKVASTTELQAEAQRLEDLGVLTPDQIAELDFEGIAAFWNSNLGREMRSHAADVRRELAFTIRFTPEELAGVSGVATETSMSGELIVAEGKADLVLILPDELRLVDFKTDRVTSRELPGRSKLYEPQLRLYAHALAQIYRRPVIQCWLYFLQAREAVRIPIT
jgi:ATP-dependent helicase/nuclease subunit A